MRISQVEMVSGAAQRLKTLLPSLTGLPGSVQAELFIIYSSLKYLSMELERGSAAGAAKVAAADALQRSIEALGSKRVASAFEKPVATEPLTDKLMDVAAILDLIAADDVPAATQDQVMEQLSQYLFDINQIDLNVYR